MGLGHRIEYRELEFRMQRFGCGGLLVSLEPRPSSPRFYLAALEKNPRLRDKIWVRRKAWVQGKLLALCLGLIGVSMCVCVHHTHLEVFHKGPGADKALAEERQDGRTLEGPLPQCPPASSAGLVVQRSPEKEGVDQLALPQCHTHCIQEREVGYLLE